MKSQRISLAAAIAAAAGCLFLSSPASAAPLSIVDVNAPAINCVFNPACKVVVDDSVGTFTVPTDTGEARLQTRTYPGVAPAPGAGTMAYEYRMDLTSVTGKNCISKMVLNFGPVAPLPYKPTAVFDVYVVTSGGLGTVGLGSALQAGSAIEFNFAKPVCPGDTSYFFGLASKLMPPKPSSAHVFHTLGGAQAVAVRVP
jgi:hypothetical protein